MAGNSRLPSLLEVDALKDEQLCAAREDREPEWNNLAEVMAENIPEENFIWGSKGQRLETKEGRYTTKGHSEKTDKLLEMKDVVEGSPNAPQSTYEENQKTEAEYLEAQQKANADLMPQQYPKVQLIEPEATSSTSKTSASSSSVPKQRTSSSK